MFSYRKVFLTLATKLLSRKTLAGPSSKANIESFFTFTFRKACGTSLGTASYSKEGRREIRAIDT
jgi:hypothetical protein